MRYICDYALKFILLFFIVARFISGPASQAQASTMNPPQEPSSDVQNPKPDLKD